MIYSTECKGIGGIIKHRHRDFIVEEIQETGRRCRVKRFLEEGKSVMKELKVPKKKEGKDYLHADLEKINMDLHEAIRILARFLGVSKKRIGYAGIKDKKAVSCQRISIWKPSIEKLQEFKGKQLDLSNASWKEEKIDLGNLLGNKFTVIIRNISLEEKELRKQVKECFKEMQEKGIANYFGEQRFGGLRKVTHLVGKALVKGNVEEAVMLYLTAVGEKEKEEVKQARLQLAKKRDFSKAVKEFPTRQRYERAMLHHLCRYSNDFAGAFSKLPKKIRFLFTHAYQSHIFNELISERMEKGIGLTPQKGEPTEKGIALGLLPGYESEFSEGIIGELEREIMDKESIEFKDFKLKTVAECSSRGSRKPIQLFPKKMKLQKIEADEFFEGKLACRISFELSKGNYATTVLRELMKN